MPSFAEVIQIRPAREEDAANIARVHVRSWQTAYRGILPDSYLDALEPSSREERWREVLRPPMESRHTFVAEIATRQVDGIVGFASGGPERDGLTVEGIAYKGEIYALYLLAEYRRQAIGHRLVAAATEWLIAEGMDSTVIWALRDNGPARAFYEALGGVVMAEKTITIGPSNLVDVAYGWQNARLLLNAAQKARH